MNMLRLVTKSKQNKMISDFMATNTPCLKEVLGEETYNDDTGKWFGIRYTQSKLSHFIPNVSAICSYCENQYSFENISHLFWSCSRVSEFLVEVFTLISTTGIVFAPTKRQFLFGFMLITF